MTPYLLSAPAAALLAGLLAAPLVLLARLSLCEPARGVGFFTPGTWTLDNLTAAADGHGLALLAFTLAFGAGVSAIATVAALPMALFIRTLPAGWRAVALAGIVLPKLGGVLVVLFGLRQLFALAGLGRGTPAALLAEAYLVLPYAVLVLHIQASGIDPALVAAARGLGAGSWQVFRRVTLPLMLPGLVLAGQLGLMWGAGAFLGPVLLGNPADHTLSVEVHRQALEYGRWPRSAADAVLLLAGVGVALGAYSTLTRRMRS